MRAKTPDETMPEKEDRHFAKSGNCKSYAHARLVRANFRHIGKQIRCSRHRSQAPEEGRKKEKDPTAACQEYSDTAVITPKTFRLTESKLLRNKKVDEHDC